MSTATPLWTARDADGPIGLTGAEAWYFQSREAPYGVFTRDHTGQASPVRAIEGLPIIGQPDYWTGIPGGYLTKWDVPARIDEVDGALRVAWQAGAGRWWDAHHIVGSTVVTARYRPDAAVVALSLADGSEVWTAPLPRESQGVTFTTDADTTYVQWTEYSPTAPTPTVIMPARVRALSSQTGQERWTVDFPSYPGSLIAGQGVVVATFDADLHFIDGATGQRTVVPTGQPPTIYPGLLMGEDRVLVALNDAVTAYSLSGEPLWRTPTALDGGPRLARTSEHVLVTTAHHTVLALSPQTGAIAWEIGVGIDGYGLLVSEQTVLVRGGSSAGIALPARIPPETATITGRVTIDCGSLGPVLVGGQSVPLDGDGRYTATLTAAGVVFIQATLAEPYPDMEEQRLIPGDVRTTTVRLDGSGRYEATDLTVRLCE